MSIIPNLGTVFQAMRGETFLETTNPKDIHDNFLLKDQLNAAFLRPQKEVLEQIYAAFEDFKKQIPEDNIDQLRMSASYENGSVYDTYAYYIDPANPDDLDLSQRAPIPEDTIKEFFKPFESAVSECFKDGDFVLELYGTSPPAKEWHLDDHYNIEGEDVIVGVLPLEKTDVTTEFPGILGSKSAPQHSICFVNNQCWHRAPEEDRPSLQAYSL